MAVVSLHAEIATLEDSTWRAQMKCGKSLLAFLAPDCVMLFPSGMKWSSTSEPSLETVLTSEDFVPWSGYRIVDATVLPLGPLAASISYRAEATRQEAGVDNEFKALISSVWRKDATTGRWQLVLHQQTPIAISKALLT